MAATAAIASSHRTETSWLPVLECQAGMLYTGIAKDVDARFAAHLEGTGAIFTRLNRPVRILGKATETFVARCGPTNGGTVSGDGLAAVKK